MSFAYTERPTQSEVTLSTKKKIVTLYFIIGCLFGLYGWLFGPASYKGLAYNLGQGVMWPVFIFPTLGKVIGALILVLFIAIVTIL